MDIENNLDHHNIEIPLKETDLENNDVNKMVSIFKINCSK